MTQQITNNNKPRHHPWDSWAVYTVQCCQLLQLIQL